jgi:endonuclease III
MGYPMMDAQLALAPSLLNSALRMARERNAPVLEAARRMGKSPFNILLFTALSARTRDGVAMEAALRLLAKAPDAKSLAQMPEGEISKLIYPVGFYRTKAKNMRKLAESIVSNFNGNVPSGLNSLLSLPGVGRKTANIVLARAFGIPALGVDVHVHRISNRMGVVHTKKPEETERALTRILPKARWGAVNAILVAHGQTVCLPRNPKCEICVFRKVCDYGMRR